MIAFKLVKCKCFHFKIVFSVVGLQIRKSYVRFVLLWYFKLPGPENQEEERRWEEEEMRWEEEERRQAEEKERRWEEEEEERRWAEEKERTWAEEEEGVVGSIFDYSLPLEG